MSIRSKLFATVALPVLSVSVAVPPAVADSLMKPFEVAQESGGQSEEELLLLKQRQAEEEAARQAEEQQRAAEEQQRAAEEEAARQQAEQQRAAEEEAARQAAEQQKAAEEEAARQAAEQQKAAEEEAARQAAEQQKAAEEEAARQAAEQQKAAEEEAARQAAEQQKAAEEEAARQAAEQQKAAEDQKAADEEAARKAAEQQKAAEDEAARQAAEQQRAAEEEAARKAAEEQKATEQAQPDAAQQPAPEGEKAAEQPVVTEEQKAGEEAPATQEQKAGEQPVVTDEQKAGGEVAPAVEPQPQTGEGQPVPGTEQPQTGEGQPVPGTEQPQTGEGQPVPGTEQPQTGEGQPVPGADGQPATAEQQPQVQQPVPEVVDTRTEEEKVKIAEDPAATDETVVLPVENGAAVLDSDKDADNAGGNQAREQRQKLREELRANEEDAPAPVDDAAAQAAISAELQADLPQKIEANLTEKGTRVDEAPVFVVPETTNIINNTVINNTVINNNTTVNNITNNMTEVKIVEQVDNRVILGVGDQIFVRGDDRPRLRYDAEETFYDQLPRGRTRETIVRPGGYRIVTVYNRYGDILQRSRVDRDGNEYLMIYAPERDEGPRPAIIDVGYELPPMRLRIPVRDYIADVSDDPDRDYYEFLAEPPVERVERVYTIDEVRHSARLRDKVRRVDLDTITFPTGSAEVSMSQAKTMRKVAAAMEKILAKDPGETFFIEGHTDAVGSDRSNLVLSDKRAESVASLLTEAYGIPPENLVTQGYGERFLKVRTQDAEQQNRRVTVRRVTPLVRPVAQR
ncbi:hypothetical protein BC374_18540 [Ensifer sp. LC13]|uniref:OmpA family protein n=1 Tax=unclassified Ensifer TaxID=2633371 RepID=UPI0008139FF4|nr:MULTISPECIES: OmpA family protein [unclassified Ensifer]OCP10242.1 hypothetical protein BC374_18540 [Ensifer sp. LC13]OCP11238.1 hypothetical protein BBX50_18750 [Ensifer sp. LC11]OCP33200.1 hypothetical protein BC364_17640 [Ensifer sp. LC499]